MGINSCILAGKIMSDITLSYTATNGVPVLSFILGVKQLTYKGGEKVSRFRVTVWRELAEQVARECKKNDCVVVSGRLRSEQFVDKKGRKRKLTEIDGRSVDKYIYPKEFSENICYLGGIVDRKPELIETRYGRPMLNLVMSCEHSAKNGCRTDVYKVIAWNETAEELYANFERGDVLLIKGHMATNSWLDENDVKQTTVVIIVDEFLSPTISKLKEPPKDVEKVIYIEDDAMMTDLFGDST